MNALAKETKDICEFCKVFQRLNSMRISPLEELEMDYFAHPDLADSRRDSFRLCETCYYTHCILTNGNYVPMQTSVMYHNAPAYMKNLDLVESTQ